MGTINRINRGTGAQVRTHTHTHYIVQARMNRNQNRHQRDQEEMGRRKPVHRKVIVAAGGLFSIP